MIINNLSSIKGYGIKVIIIGSGPAGITTALKLEKLKIKSLIIEAGDINQKEDSDLYLRGKVIGDDYPDLSSLRMRQFGGTSGHWGGDCNYFTEDDFITWPINHKDTEPYIDETKDILGLKSNFYNQKFSHYLRNYNVLNSSVRFGDKYLKKIKDSRYIHLSVNTIFTNVSAYEDSKRINAIVCEKDMQSHTVYGEHFIFCCGGIENSRLLLWCRENNKHLLDPSLPIGKSYMNHPAYDVGEGYVNVKKYNEYFKQKEISEKPFITCNKLTCLSGKAEFLKDHMIDNSGIYMEFKDSWDLNKSIEQLRCVAPNYFKEIYDDYLAKEIYKIKIRTVQEQASDNQNSITLDNIKDPAGIPLSKIFWRQDINELYSARKITEEIGKLFVNYDIGRISLYEHMYGGGGNYPITVGNHQMGGTRMGYNKNDSVVDNNLKIHGVENLFISGSSVFRTSGHCHPTFTIVQLSLRLADHIGNLINI